MGKNTQQSFRIHIFCILCMQMTSYNKLVKLMACDRSSEAFLVL